MAGLIPNGCTIQKAGSSLLEYYSERGIYSRADNIRNWLNERTISQLTQRAEAAEGLLREVMSQFKRQQSWPDNPHVEPVYYYVDEEGSDARAMIAKDVAAVLERAHQHLAGL